MATRERGKVGNGGYTHDMIYGELGRSNDDMPEDVREAMNAPERVYYKVQSGETLASIAKKVGVSVEKIMRLNGFRSKNQKVRAGMIIRYV